MTRQFIYDFLNAADAVTDICGNRIHPITAPQGGAVPFIIYHVEESPYDFNFDYPQHQKIDLASVEIRCWAKTVFAAEELHNAVRNAMQNIEDEAGNGMKVETCQFLKSGEELQETTELYCITGSYNLRIVKS